MKKTIIFKWNYLDTKKLNKTQEDLVRGNLFEEYIATFKKQLKKWFDENKIKIIDTHPHFSEIVIEFDGKNWGNVANGLYGDLIDSDIVEQIDSSIRLKTPTKEEVIKAGIEKLKKQNAKK